MQPTVLITRPMPAAARFAGQIAGLGLPSLIAPLMRIVPVAHDATAVAAARGLVLTSENAVPFAGTGDGRPAICVGPRTAHAARAAGFAVTQGPGDAVGMMPLIAGLGPGWLHLRGTRVAAELPVPGMVVYDQQALPLPPDGQRLLRGAAPVILPLFSPRAAWLAARAVHKAGATAPLWLVAISAAADAAWDRGWPAPEPVQILRRIAARPDAAAICGIIGDLAKERSGPARVEPRRGPV